MCVNLCTSYKCRTCTQASHRVIMVIAKTQQQEVWIRKEVIFFSVINVCSFNAGLDFIADPPPEFFTCGGLLMKTRHPFTAGNISDLDRDINISYQSNDYYWLIVLFVISKLLSNCWRGLSSLVHNFLLSSYEGVWWNMQLFPQTHCAWVWGNSMNRAVLVCTVWGLRFYS